MYGMHNMGSPLNLEYVQTHMASLQQVHEASNSSNGDANPQTTVAIPPTAPIILIPAHREWTDLAVFSLPSIIVILNNLTTRCADTRNLFSDALTNLEARTKIFTSERSPMSEEEHAKYIASFNAANTAGHALFPPQQAYRYAIATLGMLVKDLINVLPKYSFVKVKVRREFDEGVTRANADEQGIKNAFCGLVDGTCRGGERLALAVYMNVARRRLQNLRAEEERLKVWASECLVGLA